MKLKKLELYGFKSFAQRTEIVFDEGITGIVGPNGSGKSNIGDAVRWVLGEQSAKTLRGASMSDVIFNGTQKRKPLSYCEVSLVFDNDDHALAMEAAEVMVTRRVYRNGESEYYLNRTACRLKDVVDLFRDTGIGIAPEDLPRVFQMGYTGENGRLDRRSSGIGLYLCRRICGNLRHGIRMESVPGKGTTVYLTLGRGDFLPE